MTSEVTVVSCVTKNLKVRTYCLQFLEKAVAESKEGAVIYTWESSVPEWKALLAEVSDKREKIKIQTQEGILAEILKDVQELGYEQTVSKWKKAVASWNSEMWVLVDDVRFVWNLDPISPDERWLKWLAAKKVENVAQNQWEQAAATTTTTTTTPTKSDWQHVKDRVEELEKKQKFLRSALEEAERFSPQVEFGGPSDIVHQDCLSPVCAASHHIQILANEVRIQVLKQAQRFLLITNSGPLELLKVLSQCQLPPETEKNFCRLRKSVCRTWQVALRERENPLRKMKALETSEECQVLRSQIQNVYGSFPELKRFRVDTAEGMEHILTEFPVWQFATLVRPPVPAFPDPLGNILEQWQAAMRLQRYEFKKGQFEIWKLPEIEKVFESWLKKTPTEPNKVIVYVRDPMFAMHLAEKLHSKWSLAYLSEFSDKQTRENLWQAFNKSDTGPSAMLITELPTRLASPPTCTHLLMLESGFRAQEDLMLISYFRPKVIHWILTQPLEVRSLAMSYGTAWTNHMMWKFLQEAPLTPEDSQTLVVDPLDVA